MVRAPTHTSANGWESMWRTQTQSIDCGLCDCVRVRSVLATRYRVCEICVAVLHVSRQRNRDDENLFDASTGYSRHRSAVQAPFPLTLQ